MSEELRQEILREAEARRAEHLAAGVYTEAEERAVAELALKLPGADLPPLSRLEAAQFALSQTYAPSAFGPTFTSHRPGLGRFIVLAKKLAFRLARPFLSVLLANQVEFNRHLVGFSHETLEEIKRLEEKVDATQARVVRLVRRLEAGLAREDGAPASPDSPGAETPPAGPGGLPEIEYLAFEDRHRGPAEEIRARQARYVGMFRDLPGPVLDVGCGRGEFLELLAQAGVEAGGVDLNQEMVDHVQSLGLRARRADGLTHLRGLAPASLGGIFLAQVIEHLDLPGLTALLEAAHRALAPGGLILAETINPQSLITFASAFYLDPTHTRPIHPEAARFLLESTGFKEVRIIPANPVPEAARLKPVSSLLPGGRALNENIQRLNDLLFGHQDYAVAGRR